MRGGGAREQDDGAAPGVQEAAARGFHVLIKEAGPLQA